MAEVAGFFFPWIWLITKKAEPEMLFINVTVSTATVRSGPFNLAVTSGAKPD